MSKFQLEKILTKTLGVTWLIVLVTMSLSAEEGKSSSGFVNFLHKTFTRQEKPSVVESAASDNTMAVEGGNVQGPSELLKKETMDKIVEQKSVLDQSKAKKGQQAKAQGMLLYHQFKFAEAAKLFEEALVYSPEDENASNYLVKCRQILGDGKLKAGQASQWSGEQQKVTVQELKIKARYHQEKADGLLNEATEMWKSNIGNDGSLKKLEEARYELRRAKATIVQLPPGEEKPQELMGLNDGLSKIDALDQSWRALIQKRIESAAREKSIALSQQTKEYDVSRLDSLLDQARRMYLEGKYQESEGLCILVLGQWPKSDDARLILKKSVERKNEKLNRELVEKGKEEWRRNNEKIRDSSIAYAEGLTYSKDWLAIDKKRSVVENAQKDDPEWTKVIKQKMEALVTIHLPDNTLKVALERMQEQTGINFIIDQPLVAELSEARITEFHINSTRCSAVLELLLNDIPTKSGPLVYQFIDGAVLVSSRENQNVFKRPDQVVYDVTDLVTSFGEVALSENDTLKSGKPVSGGEATSKSQPLTTDTLIDLIKDSIEPQSWQAEGVTLSKYADGKLLVSHSSQIHLQIRDLLDMFRKQQRLQVAIETRFISSADDDLFDVGVDWKGLNEVSMTDTTTVGAGAYSSRSNISSDTRGATVMGSAADGSVGGAPAFISENRNTQGMNVEVSVLDPLRASIVLHALSRKQSAKSLLAPRLTVINNQQGYFVSSVEESYVRNYTSTNGSIIPTPDRVSSGQLLLVRPTVSSDRKYITLDLSPQITRVLALEKRPLAVPVRQNNGNNNNTNTQNEIVTLTIELPSVEVWQIQTRVQVPDGGIVFVGGRMGNIEKKTTRGVPLISKIPLLGRLFRSDGEFSELNNLIISVQAKIMVFDELESKLH